MAVNKGEIGIYGVLRRDGGDNVLARTDQIQDVNTNKTQKQLNQETLNRINDIFTQIDNKADQLELNNISTRIDEISTRVGELEVKTPKVINYKGSVRDKTALDALTDIRFGDIYKIESATIIDDKKYPAYTKFINIGTNNNGEMVWEPLGGTLEISTGLIFDSGDNRLTVNYGDGLGIVDNKLTIKKGRYSGFNFIDGYLNLSTGEGININEYGEVSVLAGNGITADTGYVSVKQGKGITTEYGTVDVRHDDSLEVSADNTLRVRMGNSSGLTMDQNGLAISSSGCIRIDENNRLYPRVGNGLIIDNDNINLNLGSAIGINDGKVNVLVGETLEIGTVSKGLELKLTSSPFYIDSYGNTSIKCGNGLRIGTNRYDIGELLLKPGMGIDTSNGNIDICFGSSLEVDNNRLGLKLTSSPLYIDDREHISIYCGSGLRITTGYIDRYDDVPTLCLNYGNSIYISSGTVNVRVSTTSNPDLASDLLISGETGLYISSSKLEQFIKKVMAAT